MECSIPAWVNADDIIYTLPSIKVGSSRGCSNQKLVTWDEQILLKRLPSSVQVSVHMHYMQFKWIITLELQMDPGGSLRQNRTQRQASLSRQRQTAVSDLLSCCNDDSLHWLVLSAPPPPSPSLSPLTPQWCHSMTTADRLGVQVHDPRFVCMAWKKNFTINNNTNP